MSLEKILEMSIYYAPVLLFALFVFWGLIKGLVRGFRKSLILFIQALIAAGICVTIFYVLVNNTKTDAMIYDISSKFIDYNNILGTTTKYQTLKEVLVDAILKDQEYGQAFTMVIAENGAYIDTLVNLAYRLVLFVVLLVVFILLVFLFYLIYLIFYPERRKKAKLERREQEGNGNGYKKHVLFGGLVGAIRGAIVGLVWMSFVGALFFIVAGGTGEDKADTYPEYTFTDQNMNTAYEAYKVVGSYGSRGIFRVLNTVKDKENVPYYLFAANMVLAGNLNDEEAGIHTTVRFTKELANYTGFVNSTIKLVLKYDKNGVVEKAMKENDSDKLVDYMNELMENEDFQNEYDALIESFDAGVYFVNFGLSFVNSIVAHRNELKFTDNLNPEIIELLDIVFDGEHKITVSSLLTEGDARQLMKSLITVLSTQVSIDKDASSVDKGFIYAKSFIPEILKLSMFKDESRKQMFNPLVQDLYDYLATKTIQKSQTEEMALAMASFDSKEALASNNAQSVDWMGELAMLLDSSLDIIDIAENVYDENKKPLEMIFDIFPNDNEEIKNENLTHYNKLIDNLSNSKLLDVVLSMTVIKDAIDKALVNLPGNVTLPSKINYANTYKDNGEIETYGEINVLLTSLRELILSEDSKDIITALTEKEYDATILKSISNLFTSKTSDGESTMVDIALKSTVINYVVSGVLLGLGDDDSLGFRLVIPSNLCELDSEEIKTIDKAELKTLFESLVGAVDVINDEVGIDFKKIVENVNDLSTSQIIEASVVSILVKSLDGVSEVAIPDDFKEAGTYESLSGDFDNNVWHTKHEIENIIYAFNEIFGISELDSFDLEASLKTITSQIGKLNESSIKDDEQTKLAIVYKSAIIKSTFKNIILNHINDELIDTDVLKSSIIIEDIDGVSSVKFTEAEAIVNSINELALDIANMNVDNFKTEVLNLDSIALTEPAKTNGETRIHVIYSSNIIKYILAKQLDNVLTDSLIDTNDRNSLYIKDNETASDLVGKTYYKESQILNLIKAVKELGFTNIDNFEVSSVQDIIFGLNNESTNVSGKTRLNVIYESMITTFVIKKQFDTKIPAEFVDENIKNSSVVKEYETLDSKTYNYYKEEEISAIIDGLNELGISDFNNIDVTIVKNSVLNLNKESSVESKTKLDVLYSSAIIKYSVSKQLDNSITESLIDLDVRDSSYVKGTDNIKDDDNKNILYYEKSEVKAIINSLDELNITDVDDIDVNSIKGQISQFNNPAKTDSSVTKLEIMYSSYILKYALAERFDDVFKNESLAVHDDVLNNSKTNNEIATNYYYLKESVAAIIDALGVNGLNISNLDNTTNINANTILTLNQTPTGETETRLHIIYKSDILAYILTDKLETAIKNNTVLVDDIDAKKSYSANVNLYKEAEIASLIQALNDLGIGDVNNVTASQITINEALKTDVLSSTILFDSVSKMVFDNDSLKSPAISKTKNSDNTVTKIVDNDQMTYLLNVLIALNITNFTSGINVTLSPEINSNIANSYILRTTVTDKVIKNAEIKVATANIDSEITDFVAIKQQELLNMLNAVVVGLGIEDVSNIGSTITLPGKADTNLNNKLNAIAASQIIRTTVTSKIKFNDGTNDIDLYVFKADSDLLDNRTGGTNNLLSIKEAEMFKLMYGIVIALGEDGETSTSSTINLAKLQAMSTTELDAFLSSTTILLVTDRLFDEFFSNDIHRAGYEALYGELPTQASTNVYKTTTCVLSTIEYYTAADQKAMVSKVTV